MAWVIPHDARRMGAWVRANPAVEIVGLDLQTYGRSAVSWRRQMEGLELFDRVTKRRLRYLVNGPSTESVCADVFEAVPARRVCLTNSTAAAPPPDPPPNQMTLVRSDRTAPTFEGRCAAQRAVVRRGARLAMARRTKGRTAEFC